MINSKPLCNEQQSDIEREEIGTERRATEGSRPDSAGSTNSNKQVKIEYKTLIKAL